MRPRGLRERARRCAEYNGCIWHWRPEDCMPRIVGLEAREIVILDFLGRPCMRHFGPGILENWGESNVENFWSTNSRREKLPPVQGLAIVAAGRSMGETDRSMNH